MRSKREYCAVGKMRKIVGIPRWCSVVFPQETTAQNTNPSPTATGYGRPQVYQTKTPSEKRVFLFGAPAGIRIPDTLIKSQVLYRLSYRGISITPKYNII